MLLSVGWRKGELKDEKLPMRSELGGARGWTEHSQVTASGFEAVAALEASKMRICFRFFQARVFELELGRTYEGFFHVGFRMDRRETCCCVLEEEEEEEVVVAAIRDPSRLRF